VKQGNHSEVGGSAGLPRSLRSRRVRRSGHTLYAWLGPSRDLRTRGVFSFRWGQSR